MSLYLLAQSIELSLTIRELEVDTNFKDTLLSEMSPLQTFNMSCLLI